MKQPKQKSPAKSARKNAKTELKARLLTTLKTILERDKIKFTKKIKKKSKKLVNAIADEVVIPKPAVQNGTVAASVAAEPKTSKQAKSKVIAKPANVKKTVAVPSEETTAKVKAVKPNKPTSVVVKAKAGKK